MKRYEHYALLAPGTEDYELTKGALVRRYRISDVTAGAIMELRSDPAWSTEREQALVARDRGDGESGTREPRRPFPPAPSTATASPDVPIRRDVDAVSRQT